MPRTPSNVPLGNRAPGFAGGFLRLRVATRFGSILSGFFRNQQNSHTELQLKSFKKILIA